MFVARDFLIRSTRNQRDVALMQLSRSRWCRLPATSHHGILILSALWSGDFHWEPIMKSLLIADFVTQFAAMACANKLMSCGLEREHVVVQVNGNVGKSASGASTSTNVISNVSGRNHQGKDDSSRSGYSDHLPHPAQFGEAQVTVALDDGLSTDDVRFILEIAGAQSIRCVDKEFVHEDSRVWPAGRQGSSTDVRRAILAARAGESLPLPWSK